MCTITVFDANASGSHLSSYPIYMALKQVHNAREESQPNASSPKSEEDKAGPHRVPENQMPVLVVMPDPTPEKIDDMGLWNF
jgi:hypothetical protein